MARETRKPLYLRKLERELRDTLEEVSEEERKYNKYQEANEELIRKRLIKVGDKLLENMGKAGRRSLVEEEKNDLLRKYIDIFNNSLVKEKELSNYRKDVGKAAKNTLAVFINEKRCCLLLGEYLRGL